VRREESVVAARREAGTRIDRSTRMATTGLAAVFDIDAQNHPFASLVAVIIGMFQYAYAGPDKSIGRSRARHWSADLMVIRVAELELLARASRRRDVYTVRAARQASAIQ